MGGSGFKVQEVRVVLIGSLHLAGQNLLALEQARRLRDLCVVADKKLPVLLDGQMRADENGMVSSTTENADTRGAVAVSRFQINYVSAAATGALSPLLEAAGVPHQRYTTSLDSEAVEFLSSHRTTGGAGNFLLGAGEGRGEAGGGGGDAASLAHALVEALEEAESMDNLPAVLRRVVGELVALLEGAHVVSFTNHETMVVNDRVSAHGKKKKKKKKKRRWFG
jgi:hypothetical protein